MRVLVLCKRQYTGRDLLDDHYGRLWELPVSLARLGHEMHVLTVSYRQRGDSRRMEDGVVWQSVDLLPNPFKLLRLLHDVAGQFAPDLILASSDALHLAAGQKLARRMKIPAVLDLYDDYEAFGLTRVPGMKSALRAACRSAAHVISVSHSLADQLEMRGVCREKITVVGNGVPDGFSAGVSKAEARKMLGLPGEDVILLGTAGALDTSRGIQDLFKAYACLKESIPGARLVLAGPRDRRVASAFPDGTIDLGTLAHAQVALLFRALDVGIICNRDSAFARACHPMKLVEMAACGLPVVCAAVGDAKMLLKDVPYSLFSPADATTLARNILAQVHHPHLPPLELAQRWQDLAVSLAGVFQSVVAVK